MQNRIDRLEGLVLSLMTNGSQSSGTAAAQAAISASRSNSLSTGSEFRIDTGSNDMIPEEVENGEAEDSEVEQVSKGIGIMKMDNGRAVFASDAHWYAILGEISEVKKYFEQHKEDYKQNLEKVQAAKADESPGTAFLLQGPPCEKPGRIDGVFSGEGGCGSLDCEIFQRLRSFSAHHSWPFISETIRRALAEPQRDVGGVDWNVLRNDDTRTPIVPPSR